MKKGLWIIGVLTIAAVFRLKPGLAQNPDQFYENLLISDDIKLETNTDQAKANAGRLLDTKPVEIKIDSPLLRSHQQKIKRAKAAEKIKAENKTLERAEPAPFGLTWGATYNEVKSAGVTLVKTGEKDYVNNFSAQHLPKPVQTFREVILTFGIENELWRIIAYGNFLEDTPDAGKVLEVYNQYYKLLEKKYGNAQQFYTPKVTNVDETVSLGGGKTETRTKQVESEIGGPGFLQELQSGEAELYATFENGKVGAALAVNVDGDNQSYITIEYKNLEIMRAREAQTLDAL